MSSVILARSENPAIHDVYRFRHQVFHDRLGWEVGSDQGLEHDRFDKLNPVHMFSRNRHRQVEACWRLLPTTGPYMLRDIFPQLLREESAPSDPHIWEISRFAVVPAAGRTPGRDQANICDLTFDLLRAGVDFADRNGIRQYVFVTSVAVERLLKSTGLSIYRFGDGRSQKVGKVLSVACWIDINDATRQAVYRHGTVSLPQEAA